MLLKTNIFSCSSDIGSQGVTAAGERSVCTASDNNVLMDRCGSGSSSHPSRFLIQLSGWCVLIGLKWNESEYENKLQ